MTRITRGLRTAILGIGTSIVVSLAAPAYGHEIDMSAFAGYQAQLDGFALACADRAAGVVDEKERYEATKDCANRADAATKGLDFVAHTFDKYGPKYGMTIEDALGYAQIVVDIEHDQDSCLMAAAAANPDDPKAARYAAKDCEKVRRYAFKDRVYEPMKKGEKPVPGGPPPWANGGNS